MSRLMQRRRDKRCGRLLIAVLLLSALAGLYAPVAQAAAPANSPIGNQAAATYTDGSGQQRSATSNPVTTIVQQVAGQNLASDNTKNGAPGSPIYFPHTVTNTGNGADTFTLTATDQGGDNFNITPVIYADANNDGLPDNNIPITVTPSLAPGASFNFVVAGTVPGGATAGQNGIVSVTSRSNFDNTNVASNTDTVTVSTNAIINVTKSLDVNSGPAGSGPYTYTLTYTNTGNNAATNLVISDIVPTGMTYVNGSGRWSTSGATALTDTAGGDPAGIDYSYTAGTRTVSATISSIAPGSSARVTFQVNVNSGLAPQAIPNVATFTYNDGTDARSGQSNTANFTVGQAADVTFTGPAAVPGAPQGSTMSFPNTLTNTGSGPDSFDITIGTSTFPAGTTFNLYQSDGQTPLLDTNGNGIPDTGQVAAGATYNVVLKVTLPTGASGGGPYSVQKAATSKFDPTQTATATDTLTTITASTMDLTNTAIGGTGAGPEVAPVLTRNGNPGTTVRFPLTVTNSSTVTDNYNLQFSANTTFTPTTPLPAGFAVVFRDATGAVITNTGNVAPGASVDFFADVTIPATATPQDLEVFFRSVSPTTGAADIIHDRVTVEQVRSIKVEPNNVGQVFQGSTIVYTHTISNRGNVTEGPIALTATDNATGFTSTLFADTNNNGVLDAADQPITSITSLAPGASVTIFVKVFAPAGAAPGSQDVTTLTATSSGGTGPPPSAAATDTTTVIAGQLSILKEQALDANADGAPEGAYSTANLTTGAVPGAGIRYRITVTNIGTAPVTSVVINDTTPGFTVYNTGAGTLSATGAASWTLDNAAFTAASTAPANNTAGPLVFTVGTLNPGQSVTIYFGVKIQ